MDSKYMILIVDDSEADRYILKRYLEECSFYKKLDIHEATDGQAAFDFLSEYEKNKEKFGDEYPPILIFLDINMPILNGYGFLDKFEKLATKFDFHQTVIMMYSSSNLKEDIDKAKKYSYVYDYLVKGSFDSQELEKKVRSHESLQSSFKTEKP